METTEASLQPALKLRQTVNAEERLKNEVYIDRMAYEFDNVSMWKNVHYFRLICFSSAEAHNWEQDEGVYCFD